MRKNGKKKASQQAGDRPQLSLAVGDFIREALYDTILVAGLAHVLEVLEGERAAVCGPRYHHADERTAYRMGSVRSSLVLGGRRIGVRRPRVRTRAGEEVMLPSWAAWSSQDPLEARALEQMLIGVSTRKYERSLEALPEEVASRGTSKSAVSQRFIQGTRKQLQKVQERDLAGLDLKVLYLDGVHFGEHVVVASVGIDARGSKHVLGLWEGATENGATCTALLEDLVGRGLRTDRALLVVIDGSKALDKAVRAVFGERALIQRCQEHKKRNVLDALPQHKRESVKRTLNAAYQTEDHARAKRMLDNLVRTLADEHPGAAAALREGLEHLLTVKRLCLADAALERTLATTNVIENLIGKVRDTSHRVKRWRGGTMILRWTAAGVLEAERHFRRVRGHRGLVNLDAALQAHDARLDGATPDGAVVAA